MLIVITDKAKANSESPIKKRRCNSPEITSQRRKNDRSINSTRKTILRKLSEPRLAAIGFHTLRHWKATTLYHETQNTLLVKEFLRHKNLDSTLMYIQLEKALYKERNDSFTVMAVKDPEQVKTMLEVGFDYVCQKDDLVFLRKRK